MDTVSHGQAGRGKAAFQEGDAKVLSKVYEKYPLALLLHTADMEATYFIEGKQKA